MSDVFLLDEDRTPAAAEDRPGLAQVIDLLQHIATKREAERRDMLASTYFTLSLDELLTLTTEISRQIFDQLASQLMLRTPEEVAATREKIDQLLRAAPPDPDGGTA
jgi:hypothetical protein